MKENFIAIFRLAIVKDHLVSGHKQNEIRELYRVDHDHDHFQEKP